MARNDIKAGSAYVELWVKRSKFNKALQEVQRRLQKFGSELLAIGRNLGIASGAMLAPLAFASKKFADFDDAMRSAGVVASATAGELADMTEHAKLLGRTTSFTATEVALLKAELGRAGFNPAQIDEMTRAVLDLARATGTEASQSSGIMAATIRQFRLEAGDATRVADGLTAAANKSFNTVEQLGEALSYAGPVAQDFNVSLEDTLAILGGLGNVGIQGSNAGTAVRRLLTLTGAEAQKLKGIFGVTFVDAAGDARPLVDVLGEVNDATADLGTAARAAKFNEAFGLLGITGASAISRSTGDIRELAEEIKSAAGIANTTAAEMDAGLGGSFRIFMSAVEGVALAVGEAVEGPLSAMVDKGTTLLGVVTELVEKNRDAVVMYGKIAIAIGAAGVAFVAAGGAMLLAGGSIAAFGAIAGVVGSVVTGIAAAVGFLLSPIGLLAVGLATGAAAWLAFTSGGEKARTTISGGLASAVGTVTQAFADFKTVLGSVWDAVAAGDLALAGEIAMKSLELVFRAGIERIAGMFGGTLGDSINDIAGKILNGDISGAWETVVLSMNDMWAGFIQGYTETMVGASKVALDAWKSTVDAMTNYILQEAAKGGAFGAFFEKFSGVDVKAEFERKQELDRQMREKGMNPGEDIIDQVKNGTYKDPTTQAIFDKINANLQSTLDAANTERQAAADELKGQIGGATGKASADVTRLQQELAELQRRAAMVRAAAGQNGPGGAGFGVGSGAGTGGAGGGLGASKSVGGFSAAAIVAQLAGTGQSPQVKAINKVEKAVEKVNERLMIDNAMLIDAFKNPPGAFV